MAKSKKNKGLHISMLIKLCIAAGLMVFLAYCVSVRLTSQVSDVKITIEKDSDQKYLIKAKEVRAQLADILGYDISIANPGQLNVQSLEAKLKRDGRVNTAEIYIDKHNVIRVNVRQNRPIVRVEVSGGEDFYLDYEGRRIPITESIRVPVVTGSVERYTANYKEIKKHNLNDVLLISRKIYDNEFLSSLVDQIDVDSNNEIVLVPKLGRGKIQLGDVSDIDEKIYKLKVYYANGLKNIGIDKFDELDLRYKNQVIPRNVES